MKIAIVIAFVFVLSGCNSISGLNPVLAACGIAGVGHVTGACQATIP